MKNICLIFRVHHPVVLNRYRFFEIGEHNNYLDEQAIKYLLTNMSEKCYHPVNHLLLRQIRSNKGRIRVAFYLSGTTAELLKNYARETYDSFSELAATGYAEFLTGTYSWSLSSKWDNEAFRMQIDDHRKSMEMLTGLKPARVFVNTDLLYDNELGIILEKMGVEGIITEGDKQVLGWKSPNVLYANSERPSQKLFFRNPGLSDDFIRYFRDTPAGDNPRNFLSGLLSGTEGDNLINLVIPYESLGQLTGSSTGSLHFMDHFLYLAAHSPGLQWCVPSELTTSGTEAAPIHIPRTIARNEGNGFFPGDPENDLPGEALSKLYELSRKIVNISDAQIIGEWNFLQTSGHFRYMSVAGPDHGQNDPQNPYGSPFEAFINYMNILNDFKIKLDQPTKK